MRRALNTVDGIADIETNPADNSCSFKAPVDLDVKETLDKFAEEGNKHIAGWSLQEESDDDAGDDEEGGEEEHGKTQTVALKLPGMT